MLVATRPAASRAAWRGGRPTTGSGHSIRGKRHLLMRTPSEASARLHRPLPTTSAVLEAASPPEWGAVRCLRTRLVDSAVRRRLHQLRLLLTSAASAAPLRLRWAGLMTSATLVGSGGHHLLLPRRRARTTSVTSVGGSLLPRCR